MARIAMPAPRPAQGTLVNIPVGVFGNHVIKWPDGDVGQPDLDRQDARLVGAGLGQNAVDLGKAGAGLVGHVVAGVADLADDGGDVDDAAALLPHHGGLEGRLGAVEHAVEVGVDHAGEVAGLHLDGEHIARDASVVDHNVNGAEL